MSNSKLNDHGRPVNRPNPMHGLIVGLTGGIACGKSTVAQLLHTKGAIIIDLDQIGHQLLKADSPVIDQLISTFSTSILDPTGNVNRTKLGKIVFTDPTSRHQLNDIVHPQIRQISRQLAQSQVTNQPDCIVVIESPLLIESNGHHSVDYIVVVSSSPSQQIERLMKRSREQGKPMTRLDATNRLSAQMPIEEKVTHADYVVDNQTNLIKLEKQVNKLWLTLTNSTLNGYITQPA